MAHRRRRRDTREPDHTPRDITTIASLPPLRPLKLLPIPVRREVLAIGDRRQYHPERRLRPPVSVQRHHRRLLEQPRPRTLGALQPFAKMKFAVPKGVAVCVRRKQRKEVLFAKRRAGKGGPKRKPRFNEWSRVKC